MDHRQLDFDKPEPSARARRGVPGAKRYKDRRSVLGTWPCLGYELTLSRYVFDRVFNQEATQSMVFEHSVKPLLGGVLEGYNATVFAYGVRSARS